MNLSVIDEVIKKWRREGINLLPPHKEETVIGTMSRIRRNMSRDVINLYCATGGMKNGEMDSLLLSLWPFERVLSENPNYKRPYTPFADCLIDSHFYCLKYKNEETSSVYVDHLDGEGLRRVADTLPEFFELYLTIPEKIKLYDLPPRHI